MKLEITLVLLAVTGGIVQSRPGHYGCKRYCDFGIKYVCSTDGTTYDNECMLICNFAHKACDGRCPCYRSPAPVVYRSKPVVNYKPRQAVNNYEGRQSLNYGPRQSVNYGPRQVVNYEPAAVNYEPAAVNYEPAAVNYPSVPDYEPIPVFTEPTPVYYDVPGQSDCVCSKDKDYVCTYDGETYENECEANCDGKAKMCDGKCPCS